MDTMELTLDSLNDLLYADDDRVPKGFYNSTILNFARSGEHYINMSELPVLVSKKPAAIKASCKRIISDLNEKYNDMPVCKIAKNDDTIILVNVAVHAAKVAEAKKAAEAEETEES